MPSPLEALVDELVSGKTFLEIERILDTDRLMAGKALRAGAREAVVLDMLARPSTPGWEEAREALEESGVEVVSGSLRSLVERRPRRAFDVVYCRDLIIHLPNLLQFLTDIGNMCRSTAIISTPVVSPFTHDYPDGTCYVFGEGDMKAEFELRGRDRLALCSFLREREIVLGQFSDDAAVDEEGLVFAPDKWWWFWTPDAFEALSRAAGFDPVKRIDLWDGRACAFVLAKPPLLAPAGLLPRASASPPA